jgi:hypothetical protein
MRALENIGFAVAIAVVGIYGLAEAAALLGARLGPHEPEHGFPVGQLIMCAILAAPKTFGRATAGQGWINLTGRIGDLANRVSGKHRIPDREAPPE